MFKDKITFYLMVLLLSFQLSLPGFAMNAEEDSHAIRGVQNRIAITFIQPDSTKMLMKVNLDQPLSEFREELFEKGRITLHDFFQHNGSDIFQGDEKEWTIREAIIDNTLSLKPINPVSSPVLKNRIEKITISDTDDGIQRGVVNRPTAHTMTDQPDKGCCDELSCCCLLNGSCDACRCLVKGSCTPLCMCLELWRRPPCIHDEDNFWVKVCCTFFPLCIPLATFGEPWNNNYHCQY